MNVRWVLAAVVMTLLVGCAEQTQVGQAPVTEVSPPADMGAEPGIEAACAAVLEFDGRIYDGHAVGMRPKTGDTLGVGVYPPCNDTTGASEDAESVDVAEIRGVDPRDAVVVPAGGGEWIWVNGQRLGADGVQRLLEQFQ